MTPLQTWLTALRELLQDAREELTPEEYSWLIAVACELDLQAGLRACLQSLKRVETLEEELRILREALEQVTESIYNATLYDPAGERSDA